MLNDLTLKIDAVLPQTQCRECDYADCLHYAKAIAQQGESIDRCVPGGIKVLEQLATLTQRDPAPYHNKVKQQQRPPKLARIRESDCIGCTKCIQACPVDAIIGTTKQMHTVLSHQCTGCELCVEPCPVDCIELRPTTQPQYEPRQARKNYQARQQRLVARESAKVERQKQQAKKQKQAYIQAALDRVKSKRQQTINT